MPRDWFIRNCRTLGLLSALGLAALFQLAGEKGAERVRSSPIEGSPSAAKRVQLQLDRSWQLDLPGGNRFDASGLYKSGDGALFTVSDREPGLFQIKLSETNSSLQMARVTNCFTPRQLAKLASYKRDRYDIEGVTGDEKGRFYFCDEADRWIIRWDTQSGALDRLEIDWSPVKKYFSADPNASFEGVAVGGGKIWVANERISGRVIVVDYASLRVIDSFMPRPSTAPLGDIHYTDLSWFEGKLYALLRHHKVILEIEPETKEVLREYAFGSIEDAPEFVYRKFLPTGTMEGLAVDKEFFWLVTDNNGNARVKYPNDIRPTLFRCRRPKE